MANEKNNNSKNILVTAVILIIVAAGAFFGGIKYQQSQTVSRFASMMGGQGRFQETQGGQGSQNGASRGMRGFSGAIVGEIVSIDANSLTVKLADGSSKIVNLSGTTVYSKTDTGSKIDLKTGTKVAAIGTTNSDGSVTAQNIQINPLFRMGNGGPRNLQPSPTK